MPYVSIPTRVDGEVLSAAYLNTLSANQEFLYGQSRQVNTPFISYRITTELLNVDDVYWTIKHRLRYFHYKVNWQDGSNNNYVKILYGPHEIYYVTGPSSGVTNYYDLDPLGLTVGTHYQLIVEVYKPSNAAEITVDYLLESDSTSI